jgi:energy-coupling factor transporter ATP-binding protein EcfA2
MNKEISDNPNLHLRTLVELSAAGLSYALIRGDYAKKSIGDLDIIVFDAHIELLESIGYILFSAKENNYKYIKFDMASGEWLHLDVYTAISFGKLFAPESFTQELHRTSFVDDYGIRRLSEEHEKILLIFHTIINKRVINKKYIDNTYLDSISVINMNRQYNFLPKPLDKYLKLLKLFQQNKIDENFVIKSFSNDFIPHKLRNKGIIYRIFRRFFSFMRGNKAIVILGPDGSGKSTLSDALVRLKWPPMQRQYMGPARMDIMNQPLRVILSFFDNLRDKWPKTNLIGILSRIGWQVTCYFDFFERLYRHIWFWGSGGVVLFDRYACDMFFRKPTKINEILFLRLFPKPKFVFLCVGDPQLIYKRKPEELSCSDIDKTIRLYREKLKQHKIKFIEIDTTTFSQEAVINKVTKNLVENNWYIL